VKHETIRACSIWRALEVVGDVPVLLILEQAFLGKHRFDEFVQETGVARSVISNRLEKLVEADVLIKLSERRAGYRLTEKGRSLFPIALMILRWQHLWATGARDIKVSLSHLDCGHAMRPLALCNHCSVEIDPRAIGWEPGPGLTEVTPLYGRRRMQTAAASAKRGNRTMVDSVIELFGDRWATLVVRACFTGIHRFDDIQRDTLMATNILSDRLERLQKQGIIKARPYSSHQDRFEYHLSAKGRDLYPVLLALLHWGDRWYADKKGPPLLLTHKPCEHELRLRPACSHCGGKLHIDNISFEV
jgi:DNA-binding HxlR family transcriptional regulator